MQLNRVTQFSSKTKEVCFWKGLEALSLSHSIRSSLQPVLLALMTPHAITYVELFWFLLLANTLVKRKLMAHPSGTTKALP